MEVQSAKFRPPAKANKHHST